MRLPHISHIAAWRIVCMFQQSAHVAYFSAQIDIFDGNFNILCVYITYFLLGFVTSTSAFL